MMVSMPPDLADHPAAGVLALWNNPLHDGALTHWLGLVTLAFEAPLACLLAPVDAGSVVVAAHGIDLLSGPPLVPLALAEQGFCVVSDARTDPSTQQHPWVTDSPKVVFLAAVALQAPTGRPLGMLCLMDRVPRVFADREARMLAAFAALLASDLALRQQARISAQEHQALEQSHGWLLETVSQDPLTQVANRRALMAFLDKTLALARRESQPMAVLLLDICGFKDINAQRGDVAGDRVLADVAGRLSAGARGSELVGRMVGDEFMAVLYPCTPDQATLAAERFAAAVQAQPVALGQGAEMTVKLAVGVCAVTATEDLSTEELYRRAAQTLDTAKQHQASA